MIHFNDFESINDTNLSDDEYFSPTNNRSESSYSLLDRQISLLTTEVRNEKNIIKELTNKNQTLTMRNLNLLDLLDELECENKKLKKKLKPGLLKKLWTKIKKLI